MNTNPFFSIIVPVYNVEKYVADCIQSLISQRFKRHEIILINDGSQDDSERICELYAREDERIKLIKQENAGLPSARNTGIRSAKGEWLVFVDSDDRIATDSFLDALYEGIVRQSPDIVVYGCREVRESDGSVIRAKYGNMGIINQMCDISEKIDWCIRTGNLPISAWLHACSRKFIEQNRLLFDESIKKAEDIEWTFRLLANSPRLYAISGTPYLYNIRANSICTGERKTGFWEYRELSIRSAERAIRSSDCKKTYTEILYSGLAYHYYVLLAHIRNEPNAKVMKHAFVRIKDLRWLQKYKADKRTNIARLIVKVLGEDIGSFFLALYIRNYAARKGQPIRVKKIEENTDSI